MNSCEYVKFILEEIPNITEIGKKYETSMADVQHEQIQRGEQWSVWSFSCEFCF